MNRQQALNWWKRQDTYSQILLYYSCFGRFIPRGGIYEREIEKMYRSYFKVKY